MKSLERNFEVGKIAKCARGNVGVICDVEIQPRGAYFTTVYKGINLETGKPWQTVRPTFLSGQEVYDLFEEARGNNCR